MPLRNRKQSANIHIHDKRHEHGVAQPATKKNSRTKSDGQPVADTTIDTSSPVAVAKSVDSPDTDDSDQQSSQDAGADGTSVPNNTMPGSSKTSSEGGSEAQWDISGDATADEQETVAVIPPAPVANGAISRHDSISLSSPIDFASTILSPQPLRDVLAVLLLLLQLPPSFLFILQAFFATMTLGQPLSSFLNFSILSSHDWFHSHNGNPSIITMVITDTIFMVFWFMVANLIPIARDLTLDFSQCVIAMSLGGGIFSKGSWNHSLTCMSIVTLPHIVRSRIWRRLAADPLHSAIMKADIGFLGNLPIFFSARYAQHGWPRMILELHILAQGAVRVIRRWIDRQPGTASSRKIDPELATVHFNVANSVSNNPSAEGARNASSDNRPPGPSPAAREVKEKNVSSGKKRRKQGNFVRSQQPFWAAIASTMVSITKDVEQSISTKDAVDAAGGETVRTGGGEGEAKQAALSERAWIHSVDQTEVAFIAIISASQENGEHAESAMGNGPLSARINGASWSHFDYRGSDQMHVPSSRWRAVKGRIYGLTPGENLFVELIDRWEGKVIYATHVVTRHTAVSDASPVVAAPPPPQLQDSLRPSSPVTTMRKAIAAAEHQLVELRTRSKKTRKDHKTMSGNLKKEVDALEMRLANSSGADDRQRAKQTQLSQTIKQAEDHIAAITQQIEEFAEMPVADRQAHQANLHSWQEASALKTAALEELQKGKAESERQIAALKAEHASLRQRIEKADTKLANQEQKRENLQTSTTTAKRERGRWDAQRAAIQAMRNGKERELLHGIDFYETQRQNVDARFQQLQQQSYFLSNELTQSPNGQTTIHHTPENSYASLANPRVPFGNPAILPGMSPYHHSRQNSNRQPRGRTSSMLSAISGFTENETGIADSSPFPDFTSALTSAGQSIARNGSTESTGYGIGGFPAGLHSGPASPTPKVGMSPIGSEAKAAMAAGGGGGPGGGGSPRAAFGVGLGGSGRSPLN